MPYLRYQHPQQGVLWVDLGGRAATIGRSSECSLPIVDENASRKHAEVRYSQGNFYVWDLDSKNGTFVNGSKVKSHKLLDGDLITIGNSTIKFLDRKA
jgi:pSer/pThr/pTyr-binding forkhead associated (FHA) protein